MANEKRLIDAKGKFTLNADSITGHIICFENGYATVFDRFAKVICKFSVLDAPTVDAVEVVHGRWVKKTSDCVYYYACSECGEPVLRGEWGNDFFSNYCPNCGAKMDGERKDNA